MRYGTVQPATLSELVSLGVDLRSAYGLGDHARHGARHHLGALPGAQAQAILDTTVNVGATVAEQYVNRIPAAGTVNQAAGALYNAGESILGKKGMMALQYFGPWGFFGVTGVASFIKGVIGIIGDVLRAGVCKFGTCIESRHKGFVKSALDAGILAEFTPDGQLDEKATARVVSRFLNDNDPDFSKIKLEELSLGDVRSLEADMREGARDGWTRGDKWYSRGRGDADARASLKGFPPPWQVLAKEISRWKGKDRLRLSISDAERATVEKAKRIILFARSQAEAQQGQQPQAQPQPAPQPQPQALPRPSAPSQTMAPARPRSAEASARMAHIRSRMHGGKLRGLAGDGVPAPTNQGVWSPSNVGGAIPPAPPTGYVYGPYNQAAAMYGAIPWGPPFDPLAENPPQWYSSRMGTGWMRGNALNAIERAVRVAQQFQRNLQRAGMSQRSQQEHGRAAVSDRVQRVSLVSGKEAEQRTLYATGPGHDIPVYTHVDAGHTSASQAAIAAAVSAGHHAVHGWGFDY